MSGQEREETRSAAGRIDPALWGVLADLADTAGLLWQKGWAERNAGNLSFDVTDVVAGSAVREGATVAFGTGFAELAGRRLLVTGAGTRMRDLAREPDRGSGILQVSEDGAGYTIAWAGAGRFVPTSELPSHLAIHAALRRRPAPPRAVVHTHPGELLALSHDPRLTGAAALNRALLAMHPEMVVVLPAGIGLVPYVVPGTTAQGSAAGAAMERHDVALWARHGAVAVGADFAEAFDLLDTANAAARLLLLCRAGGFEPEGLSDAEVAALRRAYPGPGAA
jgi:rhamnulose-1-phosphate aldolase